jgi:stage II sporulation protein AB (anti-sigma F factor)
MNAAYRPLAPASFSLALRIPPEPHAARSARAALSSFAHYHNVGERDLEFLTFALGEALANAILHSQTHDDIGVGFVLDRRMIVVTVSDRGQGLAKTPPIPPLRVPDSSETGRGFPIMQLCTDFFDVHTAPGEGTIITLGRYRHP